jgi:hypothetical protein
VSIECAAAQEQSVRGFRERSGEEEGWRCGGPATNKIRLVVETGPCCGVSTRQSEVDLRKSEGTREVCSLVARGKKVSPQDTRTLLVVLSWDCSTARRHPAPETLGGLSFAARPHPRTVGPASLIFPFVAHHLSKNNIPQSASCLFMTFSVCLSTYHKHLTCTQRAIFLRSRSAKGYTNMVPCFPWSPLVSYLKPHPHPHNASSTVCSTHPRSVCIILGLIT